MKLLFLSVLSNVGWAVGQYLVHTKLLHNQAAAYCQNRCESGLQSIHSEQQQQQIQDSIAVTLILQDRVYTQDDAVWIGLTRNSSNGEWQWDDGSPFDFGPESSLGIFPWSPGEPVDGDHGQQCIAMDVTNNFEWMAMDCNVPLPSICQHCNGVINRFVAVSTVSLSEESTRSQSLNTSTAESLCQSTHGTSLATVNSRRDFIESKTLSETLQSNTTWISGRSEPESASHVVCEVVSLLCDEWTSLTPIYKVPAGSQCIESVPESTDLLLTDRQWDNGDQPLRIKYTLSMDAVDPTGCTESGVLVHRELDGSLCGYYYIAISLCTSKHGQDGSLNLYHKRTPSNSMSTLSSVALTISPDADSETDHRGSQQVVTGAG